MSMSDLTVTENAIGASHSQLFDLQYHRGRIVDSRFAQNNCTADGASIAAESFGTGCLRLANSAFAVEDSNFTENAGPFVMSVNRDASTKDDISEQHVCLSSVREAGSTANAFLYLFDRFDADTVTVQDSTFEGGDLLSHVVWSSSDATHSGQSVVMSWSNVHVSRVAESALRWKSDESDENVNMKWTISQSVFTTTALDVDLLSSDQTIDRGEISFDSCQLRSYTDRYASDWMMNVRSEGSPLLLTLNANSWTGLDVDWFVVTDGAIDMVHTAMNIADDSQYLSAMDPLTLAMSNVHWTGFDNAVHVRRSNVSRPDTTTVTLTDCSMEAPTGQTVDNLMAFLVQPTDSWTVTRTNLTRSSLEMTLSSRADTASASEEEVLFEDCRFSGHANKAAVVLTDLDDGDATYRPTLRFVDSRFDSIAASAGQGLEVDMRTNDDAEETTHWRLKFESCRFDGNDVEQLVHVQSHAIDSVAVSSVHFVTNTFESNTAGDALIYLEGTQLNEVYGGFAWLTRNVFSENTVGTVVRLVNSRLLFEESTVEWHRLLINATLADVDVHNVTSSYSRVLYLDESRKGLNSGSLVNFVDCWV